MDIYKLKIESIGQILKHSTNSSNPILVSIQYNSK